MAPPDVPSLSPTGREAVLGALRERLLAFAASRYGRDRADDLAQEVMVVLHEKYGHLERLEDLVPLSFQILRFKQASWQHTVWRRGEHVAPDPADLPLASEEPGAEAALARRELLERLTKGLAELGDRCRELFRLKLQGRTFPEIQGLLGAATLNTVYTWDHRCRKQLLERLGGRWEP